MAPQRESREGVEKRGRLPTGRASRITHHIVAGCQGEVYCVLKAERNVVLPVNLCRAVASPGLAEPQPDGTWGGGDGMGWDGMARWELRTHHIDSVRLSIASCSSCSEPCQIAAVTLLPRNAVRRPRLVAAAAVQKA